MPLLIFIILCLIITICFLLNRLSVKKRYDKEIENKNRKLKTEYELLTKDKINLENNIELLSKIIENSNLEITQAQEAMKKGLELYGINLEYNYQNLEDEYDKMLINLENSYDEAQNKKIAEITQVQKELDTIRNTRVSAIEAQLREKEIKDNISFYCLQPSQNDIDDVHALERVKPNLHQPRILCMLIWSTYFQKPMTALCNNVLGTAIVSGIYKITNQETGECYIGQAVDVAKRWKDHAKCGLGIDTPPSNKLYKAIQEYGIWNFSWELLEKCNKQELNEKEDFYIGLYDSKNYGYNSSIVIKKN